MRLTLKSSLSGVYRPDLCLAARLKHGQTNTKRTLGIIESRRVFIQWVTPNPVSARSVHISFHQSRVLGSSAVLSHSVLCPQICLIDWTGSFSCFNISQTAFTLATKQQYTNRMGVSKERVQQITIKKKCILPQWCMVSKFTDEMRVLNWLLSKLRCQWNRNVERAEKAEPNHPLHTNPAGLRQVQRGNPGLRQGHERMGRSSDLWELIHCLFWPQSRFKKGQTSVFPSNDIPRDIFLLNRSRKKKKVPVPVTTDSVGYQLQFFPWAVSVIASQHQHLAWRATELRPFSSRHHQVQHNAGNHRGSFVTACNESFSFAEGRFSGLNTFLFALCLCVRVCMFCVRCSRSQSYLLVGL